MRTIRILATAFALTVSMMACPGGQCGKDCGADCCKDAASCAQKCGDCSKDHSQCTKEGCCDQAKSQASQDRMKAMDCCNGSSCDRHQHQNGK